MIIQYCKANKLKLEIDDHGNNYFVYRIQIGNYFLCIQDEQQMGYQVWVEDGNDETIVEFDTYTPEEFSEYELDEFVREVKNYPKIIKKTEQMIDKLFEYIENNELERFLRKMVKHKLEYE